MVVNSRWEILKILACSMLCVVVVHIADHYIYTEANATSGAPVVTASHFVLLDEQNRHRGGLGFDGGNPTFYLMDEDGKYRAYLTSTQDGPMLALRDKEQVVRLFLDFNDRTGPLMGIKNRVHPV